MKKVLIAVLLVVATLGICAQEKWTFSLLPGYQFSNGDTRGAFLMSADGGYRFTENFALHFAYLYNQGKFKVNLVNAGPYTGAQDFDMSYGIIEVGPEIYKKVGEQGEIYGQFNLGHTLGAGDINVAGTTITGATSNEWTYGIAFGYRYFFNKQIGITVQGAYHYIRNWDESGTVMGYTYSVDGKTSWDARVGVTWKF